MFERMFGYYLQHYRLECRRIEKCIQRNNVTLFKKFLIHYGPLTARAKQNLVDGVIRLSSNIDIFKFLIDQQIIDDFDYCFKFAMSQNSFIVCNFLKDLVSLTKQDYISIFEKEIKSFEIYKLLFDKTSKEFTFDIIFDDIIYYSDSIIYNKYHVLQIVNSYFEDDNLDDVPLWFYNFKSHLCRNDNIKIIKLYEQQDFNIINLFETCINEKAKKCLNLLVQNKSIQKILIKLYSKYKM